MERELFTRNFMTGWVLVAGFLSSWLPPKWPSDWSRVESFIGNLEYDVGPLIALVAALISTPIIGYVISALVIAYMYLQKGDPYRNVSRNRTWEIISDMKPDLLQTGSGHDALFAYLLHVHRRDSDCESFIDWGRRQHTSRFLAYNWSAATMIGIFIGCAMHWGVIHPGWSIILASALLLVFGLAEGLLRQRIGHDRHARPWHYLPYSLYLLALIATTYSLIAVRASTFGLILVVTLLFFAVVMLYIGGRSELKVEDVERLLVEHLREREGNSWHEG